VLNPRAINEVRAAPDDPEEAAALRDALRVAIAAMAEEDLEILVWYGIDEETLEEIGQRLGISRSGAHARLSKARRQLADSLAAACAVYGLEGGSEEVHG
jgi:RNA polymerase sigma factor (sigma-70 family)